MCHKYRIQASIEHHFVNFWLPCCKIPKIIEACLDQIVLRKYSEIEIIDLLSVYNILN